MTRALANHHAGRVTPHDPRQPRSIRPHRRLRYNGRVTGGGITNRSHQGDTPVHAAVVIPTYRRPRELEALVDSLCAGSRPPDRVVIVDNDPEASCPAIERPDCAVDVIHLGAGLNLPGARNAGWRAASDADVVFFIDDDNRVDASTLGELVDVLADPGIGLVAPVIFCAEPPDLVWCGGIERSRWTTRTRLAHRGETTLPDQPSWRTEDAPDALAIPRAVLEQIGGFDEANFPFGHDEADIAARIGELGLQRVVARDAHIWHEGGMPGIREEYARASGVHGNERVRLNWRGRVLFHRRYSDSNLQRLVALGIFIPAGALVATAITMTVSAPVRDRLSSTGSIWRGILEGYRWRWRGHADERSVATERS